MKKGMMIVFLGFLILGTISQSALAQSVTPPATATSTLVPEAVATLQSAIATQQVDITEQSRITTHNAEDLARAEADWQWKWGIAGLIVGAFGTYLGSIGLSTLTDFKKRLQGLEKDFSKQINQTEQKWRADLQTLEADWSLKSQLSLNNVLNKFDITRLPVYVPKKLGQVRLRLENRGLKPKDYEKLEDVILNGVIVVVIETDEDEIRFQKLIEDQAPNPKKTAFVLFAPSKRVSQSVLDCYDNLITANFFAAVVTQIFAIGRDLDIDRIDVEGA